MTAFHPNLPSVFNPFLPLARCSIQDLSLRRNNVGVPEAKLPSTVRFLPDVGVSSSDQLPSLGASPLHDCLASHRDRQAVLQFDTFHGPVKSFEVDHSLANHVKRCLTTGK